MKVKSIYLILFLLFTSHIVNSQSWGNRKYEFYYGIGALNFMGDVGQVPDSRIYVVIPETISPTLNAGFKYNYSGKHHVTGALFMGQMYAKDHDKGGYEQRKAEFNSFFTELSFRYDYQIFKEKSRRTVHKKLGETNFKNLSIPIYIFGGIGGVFNIGKLTMPSGKELLEKNYTNIAPVGFVGFGFRKQLNRYNYFTIEANYRIAYSDNLDGANGGEDAKFGKWYDEYQTITVNYTHLLRSKRNGLPKFKRR